MTHYAAADCVRRGAGEMYTQGLDQKEKNPDGPAPVESAERLAAFQARVAAEKKIEPKDWMPEAYR